MPFKFKYYLFLKNGRKREYLWVGDCGFQVKAKIIFIIFERGGKVIDIKIELRVNTILWIPWLNVKERLQRFKEKYPKVINSQLKKQTNQKDSFRDAEVL